MLRRVIFLATSLQMTQLVLVESAKQQLQLSESYLPVAMQVIAHLTDQMAFEVKDEPSKDTPVKPSKPSKPSKPTTSSWPKPTVRPTVKPTVKPVTPQYVPGYPGLGKPPPNGWWMNYGLPQQRIPTTPFHRPGLFAPVAPPKPSERNRVIPKTGFILPPFDHNTQYTVIEPQEKRTEEPLLSIQNEEVKPLIEPAKDPTLLPPHFETDKTNRADGDINEYTEDNLQYLSENVRDMIKMANDPDDERVVDVWEGLRVNNREVMPKAKLSSSNLRLLLLYDLLSREAKRLRLADYSGFSPDVMKILVDSSGGGARAQLSMALSKMVERKDCEHEYANNRAKEMVIELGKDDSTLSSELRYLQPLVYKL